MSSITLNVADIFPAGTSVAAYPRSNWYGDTRPNGTPQGSSAATATVAADGTLTFSTLTDGIVYFAYARVSGVDKYRRFMPSTSPSSAGSSATVAPSPGGQSGKKPSMVRPQPLTTTGVLVFAYEGRRFRVIVDNPTGSGNDIQIGYNVAKNRNAAGTYPTTVSPGQTFTSDTFYPYPVWIRTAAGTVTANVRQELVADR